MIKFCGSDIKLFEGIKSCLLQFQMTGILKSIVTLILDIYTSEFNGIVFAERISQLLTHIKYTIQNNVQYTYCHCKEIHLV